ncbi:hypothetical protein [Chitinimonas naiadis]
MLIALPRHAYRQKSDFHRLNAEKSGDSAVIFRMPKISKPYS